MGRHNALTESDLQIIKEALLLDETLTKRDIAFNFRISVTTLNKYLKGTKKGRKTP